MRCYCKPDQTLVSSTTNKNGKKRSGNARLSSRANNRTEVPPPNPTATALLQAYLTLNNLTRTSGDNSKHIRSTVPNTTVAVSKSAATKSFSDVRPDNKYDFCVKVINPDKKSEFSTYVLRDITREGMNTPENLRKNYISSLVIN